MKDEVVAETRTIVTETSTVEVAEDKPIKEKKEKKKDVKTKKKKRTRKTRTVIDESDVGVQHHCDCKCTVM